MLESAKEGVTGLSEGSDIGLGCRGWVFKSPHSDQNPSEIVDFRGIFLFFVYCGAGGEKNNKTYRLMLPNIASGVGIIPSRTI